MEPLPKFELFPDPVKEEMIEPSTETCGFCGRARGALYTGTYYGEGDLDRPVCPWCIADGTAAAQRVVFNDATKYPTGPTTPQMCEEDRILVECRTLGFTTWQSVSWENCCGRACIYLGEAQEGDLRGRWASAVPAIFAGDGLSQEEIDDIIDNIGQVSPAAYVFQCQICGKLCGDWDCD